MSYKDYFDKELEKAKPEIERQVMSAAQISAHYEKKFKREAAAKDRKTRRGEELHNRLKPIIDEFLKAANRVTKRGKLILTRPGLTDLSNSTVHYYNIEIRERTPTKWFVFIPGHENLDIPILTIGFTKNPESLVYLNDRQYNRRSYGEKDLAGIEDRFAADLIEMTKHNL
jgi:hypothetical protein